MFFWGQDLFHQHFLLCCIPLRLEKWGSDFREARWSWKVILQPTTSYEHRKPFHRQTYLIGKVMNKRLSYDTKLDLNVWPQKK